MALLDENIQFHLKTTADQVGKYVILPGDPGRVEKIAKHLDWVEEIKSRNNITAENCEKILRDEIGKVFADILCQCGVFDRTDDGKKQFLKFIDKVNED